MLNHAFGAGYLTPNEFEDLHSAKTPATSS